jgi:dTDP-L-rhamnose 4-epimerase
MTTTVLVTGGAGFIGCALSKQLPDHFDRVVAFDNLHPQIHPTATRPADLDERVEMSGRTSSSTSPRRRAPASR